MAIFIEDSSEIPCDYCVALKRSFYWVSFSAVIPLVTFTALLLLMSTEIDYATYEQTEIITRYIIQAILAILYLQLIVAASILVISFAKRHTPIFNVYSWYLTFHIIIMVLYVALSTLMTGVNNCILLSFVTFFAGLGYFATVYRKMKKNNFWSDLRRLY
ncbi:uncharacterized protein LOC125225255 [Leguminivora glycinivorella]|uniref:uncharacterized protein LOC125225255 n=1 Tax=Leguminivora glycinivorella TaxID=1035111 RepID=UPI00200D0C59|nr:uncharacterized protein LOC125225255 [Leguminivora glycinivorella]